MRAFLRTSNGSKHGESQPPWSQIPPLITPGKVLKQRQELLELSFLRLLLLNGLLRVHLAPHCRERTTSLALKVLLVRLKPPGKTTAMVLLPSKLPLKTLLPPMTALSTLFGSGIRITKDIKVSIALNHERIVRIFLKKKVMPLIQSTHRN